MTDESPFDNTPARLPSRWELIVQLVGTFGLAVFLVLYYVLVMQPREQARYEELRLSVDAVLQMVEAGQTFVTREQSERLKELFILSAAPEAREANRASSSRRSVGATPFRWRRPGASRPSFATIWRTCSSLERGCYRDW